MEVSTKKPLSLKHWFSLYRPYIALVVAVGLVVIGPRLHDDASDTTAHANAGAGPSGAVTGAGGAGGLDAAAGAADPGQAAATGGGVAPAAGGSSGGGKVSVNLASYPGAGTPAALANPKCDPKTGRIKFPSLFAPPCVAPWPAGADNGGNTAVGVTATSISMVVLMPPPLDPTALAGQAATQSTPEQIKAQATETLNAFADNYELWGRKLDIHFVDASGSDEAAQRADAVQAYNTYHPFMQTTFLGSGTATPLTWSTELSARGVISYDNLVPFAAAHAQPGLRWSFAHDDRLNAMHVGEYVGKRVARRPAKWAGDAALQVQTRSLGLVYDDVWDKRTFDARLAQYGGALADAVSFHDTTDITAEQQETLTQMTRFRAKGITSVIVVAGPTYLGLLQRAATQQNYHPEWILTGWAIQDVAVGMRLFGDGDQSAHAFGIGAVQPLESPLAISERNQIIQWATGHQPATQATNGQMYLVSKDLMAGIQMAGPRLTATTFRDAMFRLPPSGGKWCKCVLHLGGSFGRHLAAYSWDKYFNADDFTEKWWDNNAVGEDELGNSGKGRFQIVDGGRRFGPGDWPTTDPDVFNPDHSVMSYSTPPPEDKIPSYPPPKH
jgi:hypothetical protein